MTDEQSARPTFVDFVDTGELETDRLVFTLAEHSLIEAHAQIAAFSRLTGAHVIGLLQALGEYEIRAGYKASHWQDVISKVWSHPDAIEWHDALYRFWRTRHNSWARRDEPDNCSRDVAIALPDPQRPVFLPETKQDLAQHKYIKGLEHITVSELCVLLGRVSGYSAVARSIPELEGAWIEGPGRLVHGHNQILSFARQPFTYAQFRESSNAARKAADRRP